MDQKEIYQVQALNYYCRTYDASNKLIISTKNRIQAIFPDAKPDQQDEIRMMESLKGKLLKEIKTELEFYPVYTEWLQHVPGAGPKISSNLILLFNYKFTKICKDCGCDVESDGNGFKCVGCGKKMKGDGLLKYKITKRDFPTVSKWWKFMGRGINPETGRIDRREKGKKSNWSSRGKAIGYDFGDQVNRQKPDNLYKKFLLERREKRLKTHPGISKGANLAMAKNETIKLFLAHFWHVSRTLEGKSTVGPYVQDVLKHSKEHIIPPFYWDEKKELKAA